MSFDDAVGTPGADGRLEVVYPAGPATLTATDLPIAFGAHLPDETEAARLVRYQTLWDGVLTSIDATTPPPPVTSTTVPGEQAQVEPPPLPVEQYHRVDRRGRVRGDGAAREGVCPASLRPTSPIEGPMRLLVAEAMPGVVSPPTNSARIRLVNTTGDEDAMLTAADLVLVLQANLVIASDAAAVDQTQVLYASPGFKGAADFVAQVPRCRQGRAGRYRRRRHRPHGRAGQGLRSRGRQARPRRLTSRPRRRRQETTSTG